MTLPTPKKIGRPRLSNPERRRRVLASKAKWREDNREYYRAQINRLSTRPEYKERRKELRALARAPPEDTPTPTGLEVFLPQRAEAAAAPPEAA